MSPSTSTSHIAGLCAEIKKLTAQRDAAIERAKVIDATARELCRLFLPETRVGCWCSPHRDVDRKGHSDACVLARTLMFVTREDPK